MNGKYMGRLEQRWVSHDAGRLEHIHSKREKRAERGPEPRPTQVQAYNKNASLVTARGFEDVTCLLRAKEVGLI